MIDVEPKPKSRRGFASMDPEKHRAICKKGGISAHAQGKGHKFTREEASAAGKIGGAFASRNREFMTAIGRLGGLARGRQRAAEIAKRERDAIADEERS